MQSNQFGPICSKVFESQCVLSIAESIVKIDQFCVHPVCHVIECALHFFTVMLWKNVHSSVNRKLIMKFLLLAAHVLPV